MNEKCRNYKLIRKNWKLKELEYGEKKLIVNNSQKNSWNGKKLLKMKEKNNRNNLKKIINSLINNFNSQKIIKKM